jgi:hypothetical protein
MVMTLAISGAVSNSISGTVSQLPAVCPVAPPGAQVYTDQLLGYVLWAVITLFVVGVVVAIGAIVGGRIFSMPGASRGGVVAVVMVFLAVIGYLVLPGVVRAMTGTGCV